VSHKIIACIVLGFPALVCLIVIIVGITQEAQ
jgi:hypothetical protein